MRRAALIVCASIACGSLAGATGCDPATRSGADASLDTGPEPLTPVTVKSTLNWLNDAGQVTSTLDITSIVLADVVARIPSATAQGGFDTYAAEMTSSGLAIRDVPASTPYYLDARTLGGRAVVVTTRRDVELKFYEVGRRDPPEATRPTLLTLTVTNMAAWQDTDTVRLTCENLSAFGSLNGTERFVTGWPKAGDRQMAITVDWALVDRGLFQNRMTPLIDGNAGDRLVVSHMRRNISSSNGYGYEAAIATATFESFAQQDGVARSLTAAFTTDPKDAVHFNLKRPAFAQYAGDVHPDAVVDTGFLGGGGLSVRGQPADPNRQHLFSDLSPAMVFTLFGTDTTDLDMGLMVFPRPPAGWSQWLRASHKFVVTRETPLGIPQTVAAHIGAAKPITPPAAPTDSVMEVVPRISPPKNPRINTLDFHAPHLGLYQPTGAPIAVTWEEPTLADVAPTTFALEIFQLTRNGDALTPTLLATIFRAAKPRTIEIPWPVIPGTGTYYFVLTAVADSGAFEPDLDDIGDTDSTASTVSGIVTLR